MGLWKGKKGSSVFYKIWNSNNKEKQGVREYQPEVRNPQTNAQTDQRMRMLPAQLVKGALRDIVSRSFQGVEYGSKSRIEFLKYALRAEIYPYLPKGWSDPLPGSYLISRGTLPSIGVIFDSGIPGFYTQLAFQIPITVGTTTVGEVATELLSRNGILQEGDQLTFVICEYWPDYLNHCRWHTLSLQLDPTSTDIFVTTLDTLNFSTEDQVLALTGTSDNGIACGVILSRLGPDGLYLRNNTELVVARDFSAEVASYYSATAQGEARRSYQKQTTRSNYDWPVEDGESTRGGTGTEDGTYILSGFTGNMASLNGEQVKVRVETGTSTIKAVYVITAAEIDYLVNPDGNEITYFVDGVGTSLRKDQVTALANLPTIVYTNASRNAAMAAPMAEDEKPKAEAEKKATRSKK